jgi:predicted DNA-binding transcriptional regulator YafY
VLDSLVKGRAMRLEYSSPHTGETTSREVFPLHLLHYMGTWHLIGHCGLRGGLRYFTLSRIAGIGPSGYRPDTRIPQGSIKDYIRKNFGILAGEERYEVCLRFSKDASPWVAEQVWHPGQEAEHRDDGTLCLKFLVADLREVKREVLRHGAEVEVLEPEELREAVKAEIARMRGVYG